MKELSIIQFRLTKEAYAIIFSMDCKPIEASEQERINLFAGASSKTLNEKYEPIFMDCVPIQQSRTVLLFFTKDINNLQYP